MSAQPHPEAAPVEECSITTSSVNILDALNDDLLGYCLEFLSPSELRNAEHVCHRFASAINYRQVWLVLASREFPDFSHLLNDMDTSDLAKHYPQRYAVADDSEEERRRKQLHAACKRFYASMAAATARPEQVSLLHQAIFASSTDHPEEDLSKVLTSVVRTRSLACYWSSVGADSENSNEIVAFKLAHPLTVIHAVEVRPFQAWFQPDEPIYAPKRIQVAMGGLEATPTSHHRPGNSVTKDNYIYNLTATTKMARTQRVNFDGLWEDTEEIYSFPPLNEEKQGDDESSHPGPASTPRMTWRDWITISEEYSVLQADFMQVFPLVNKPVCVGGYFQLNLLERTQQQEADDLWYTCLGHVRCRGKPVYHFAMQDVAVSTQDDEHQYPTDLDGRVQLKVFYDDVLTEQGGIEEYVENAERQMGSDTSGSEGDDDLYADYGYGSDNE